MKNIIFKIQYIVALFCFLAIMSCSKEGDIGPKGEQGVQGEPGQDGSDGVDGQDGNANVIASDWMAFDTTQLDALEYNIFRNDANFTQEVFDSAVVMAYGSGNSAIGTFFSAFPITYENGTKKVEHTFIVQVGAIHILNKADSGSLVSDSTVRSYRYVIVPSSSSSGKTAKTDIISKLKKAGVDINNYEQVANYFGLEE